MSQLGERELASVRGNVGDVFRPAGTTCMYSSNRITLQLHVEYAGDVLRPARQPAATFCGKLRSVGSVVVIFVQLLVGQLDVGLARTSCVGTSSTGRIPRKHELCFLFLKNLYAQDQDRSALSR